MIKTVIVGASAYSTPALFDTALRLDERAFSFVFAARNLDRLGYVGRAVNAIAAERGYLVCQEAVPMAHLESTLAGADLIVIQIRTNGYRARDWDEQFPLRYGQVGNEGLGLGGLAAAWRTWPEVREILARIAFTGSKALVLLLTSPVGILTRCALREFPQLRLYGICELPWTTLLDLCGNDITAASSAQFSYVGVNHVGWLSNVRTGSNVLLALSEVLPLKYVELGEGSGARLCEQVGRVSRARELNLIADEAFRAYEHGTAPEIIAAVRRRATPWYAHALAPLLAELSGRSTGVTFFLTGRNASYCAWLADDDVIEMPFSVRSCQPVCGALDGWSRDDVAERLTSFVTYEALAADAIQERDAKLLAAAIGAHPWLHDLRVDAAIMQDVLREAPFLCSDRVDT